MKFAISNIAWDNKDNEFVYNLMKKYGFTGLEIAPTKIIPSEPYLHVEKAVEWVKELTKNYGFCIPSMQSIWFGKTEKLFGSESERISLLDYTKSAIDFASAIGCKNLVFGCPKNRIMPANADKNIAVDFFRTLGNYANEKNTCIGMEANPEIYGTNFINTTEQALNLIKSVDSEGFKLNLDIGTMIQNCESVSILENNTSLINHIHISEPFLKKIQENELHNHLFDLLKKEKYKFFVSVEMSLQNNMNDIEDTLKYIREIAE